ncbi:ATP-binding protein [Streptomyces microflavus]|uniref:ATP-binding protein n=1 Tax=Streptomyces microflavus TaxID=1919 RepID=UPI00380360CC
MPALVIAVLVLVALVAWAGFVVVRLRRELARSRRELSAMRRSEQEVQQGCVDRDAAVARFATFGVAALGQAARGLGYEEPFESGKSLAGTAFAQSLRGASQQITAVVQDAVAAARAEVAEQQRQATEAAVIAFSRPVQSAAAALSKALDEARDQHKDDQSFATLVTLDHIAEKLRRAAASPGILCGAKPSRRWPPTTLTDVLRGAQGRIEAYTRVQVQELSSRAVAARAVEPVTHALANLMENATKFSSPTAMVDVAVQDNFHGVTITVSDGGVRMNGEQLEDARKALSGAKADLHALGPSPKIGLWVVGTLAAEYGFQAFVDTGGMYGGTRAILHLPSAILTAPPPVAQNHLAVGAATAARPDHGIASPATESAPGIPGVHPSGLPQRQRGTTRGAGSHQELPPHAQSPGDPGVMSAWIKGIQAPAKHTASADPDRTDC